MVKRIFIKNFKAFEKETIVLNNNNIFIGDNDSGKSTILEALDIFFNQEKIELNYVRDTEQPVEIGVLINNNFYKKIYTGKSYKHAKSSDNINELPNISYVYIPSELGDVKTTITKLAISKAKESIQDDTIQQIQNTMNESLEAVLDTIDPSLVVVNSKNTLLTGISSFKIESAMKFEITSEDVPLEGRGSGYRKNILYALLTEGQYENVIIGIDEIENSLSINNASQLMRLLSERFLQTLITTHSPQIIKSTNYFDIYPLYNATVDTISSLYSSLDSSDDLLFIIVEGKYDMKWIQKCIDIIGYDNNYILIPGGGSNSFLLKDSLERKSRKCVMILDGDTNEPNYSLSKECIELYTPLDTVNDLLSLELLFLPKTKKEFFESTIIDNIRDKNTVKEILSRNVDTFLKEDNQLINEIKNILDNYL